MRCGSLWAFGPSAHRAHASLRALPGFGADSRSLNRRGGRRPRPPLVSLPRKYRRSARCPRAALVFAHAFGSLCRLWRQQPTGLTLPSGAPSGRFALRATAHRADASLRCPKPCAAAQKSERCECPKGTRNAPRSNTLLSCMTHKRRGHPLPGGAAPLLFKKHYHLERPAFLASLRSLATLDGLCRRKRWRPPASSCIKPRFLRPGCSIIRASLTVALMVSLPRFGSLWAFGPTAHRADASLRAFGHTKRSRAAGAGEARTHGASGGRGDAPTAAGAGACSGASADWDKEHGPAGTAAGCGEARFLLPVAQSFALP